MPLREKRPLRRFYRTRKDSEAVKVPRRRASSRALLRGARRRVAGRICPSVHATLPVRAFQVILLFSPRRPAEGALSSFPMTG
jgi:hypothetical protein